MRWIVVGGGTAGCVVAARLSAVARFDVTLLEAGGGDGRRAGGGSFADLAVPGGVWDDLRPYVQGRGLGGSSRVNGAVLSGEGVELLPVEAVDVAELGPVDRALLAAAPDAQPVVLARRERHLLSAADVFLAPVLDRPNLRVVTDAPVSAVRLAAGRAVGVTLADGSTLDADRVVLCAGAIHSPAILGRSGLGDPRLGELADHPARMIELDLREPAPAGELVTGAVLRRGGSELVALNHLGDGRAGRAGLVVGALDGVRRGRVAGAGDVIAVAFDPLDADATAALDAAVDLAADVLATAPFRELVADWRAATEVGGYFHATGSCRGIVDAAGAVVGVDGLHVADASIIPLPPSGLYAPVVAAAARVAEALAR